MIIQRTLLWCTLDKYFGTLLSLTAVFLVFMNFYITDSFNILMISIFQYLTDSSTLKNFLPFWEALITSLITNKLILIAFSESYLQNPCRYRTLIERLMYVQFTSWFHINCFCINPSDEMTSMNGIALRSKFNLLSMWYSLPYNTHFWQFLWSWELACLVFS